MGCTSISERDRRCGEKSCLDERPPGIAKQSARKSLMLQCLLVVLGFLGHEVRPPGVTKWSATTESDIAVSWPRAKYVDSAAGTAALKSAGEGRPPGIAKQSVPAKLELAESFGEAGPSRSKASGINSAAGTAAVKSDGEFPHCGIVKYGATKESKLALSRTQAVSLSSLVSLKNFEFCP